MMHKDLGNLCSAFRDKVTRRHFLQDSIDRRKYAAGLSSMIPVTITQKTDLPGSVNGDPPGPSLIHPYY